jgi:hypothetical protein
VTSNSSVRGPDGQSEYRTLRLCSGGGGFEAIPRTERRLDLESVKRALDAASIPTIDARVMLIASFDPEVTISTAGRILIKTSDAALAQRTFERVIDVLPAEAPRDFPQRHRLRSG